ncbi:MAG: ankyrin repeat domain-containing protein [Rickettsiaceae bacterium]|nr:ankyrin repeat domain-containing protein [Rickettsiaceae bacterium]
MMKQKVLGSVNDYTQLSDAVRNGNLQVVEQYLENGLKPYIKSFYYPSLLISAIQKSDADMIELLIEYGAKANQVFDGEDSPLSYVMHMIDHSNPSVQNVNLRILDLLLSYCADPNRPFLPRSTALSIATSSGNYLATNMLLNYGANTNLLSPLRVYINSKFNGSYDKYLVSPLYQASYNGNLNIVELLLSKGASAQIDESLNAAVQKNYLEIAETLIQCNANTDQTIDGLSILNYNLKNYLHYQESLTNECYKKYYSEVSKQFNFITCLLENTLHSQTNLSNISINQVANERGYKAIHLAIQYCDINIIRILLYYYDINELTGPIQQSSLYSSHLGASDLVSLYQTPLMIALLHKRQDVSNMLISRGANLERQDCDGNTSLHHALKMGMETIAHLIAFNMKNVNIKNSKGTTPLHLCAQRKNYTLYNILFDKLGADPTLKDAEGMTPADKFNNHINFGLHTSPRSVNVIPDKGQDDSDYEKVEPGSFLTGVHEDLSDF